MKRTPRLGLIAVLTGPIVAQEAAGQAPTAIVARPAHWAEPVALQPHRLCVYLYELATPGYRATRRLVRLP